MPVIVKCPKCGTTKKVGCGVGFTCITCKSQISVDSNGKISRFKPSK